MINYRDARIDALAVHYVGNHMNQGKLYLSSEVAEIRDEDVERNLLSYFCKNFREPAFYSFQATEDSYVQNEMYNVMKPLFDNPSLLLDQSVTIAQRLYDATQNAAIKDGDLMVAYISDLIIEDEMTSAIAIFKSENKDDYIKLLRQKDNYRITKNQGINIGKLDKACLIFNTEATEGYRILVTDKKRLNGEAYYWNEKFLEISPRSDEYYNTAVYIQATKSFIDDQMFVEGGFDKGEEATMLEASKQYFEENENFNEEEYLQAVFHDEDKIDAFDNFKKNRQLNLLNHFDISDQAVKKNSNVFKSVIKLDRNFHIYVHGNRSMISRGEDADGRKFYKLYYNEEA